MLDIYNPAALANIGFIYKVYFVYLGMKLIKYACFTIIHGAYKTFIPPGKLLIFYHGKLRKFYCIKYLRWTDNNTAVLKGGFKSAGCSASQAHVISSSALVGRNLIKEVVVIRSPLDPLCSSSSWRVSKNKKVLNKQQIPI